MRAAAPCRDSGQSLPVQTPEGNFNGACSQFCSQEDLEEIQVAPKNPLLTFFIKTFINSYRNFNTWHTTNTPQPAPPAGTTPNTSMSSHVVDVVHLVIRESVVGSLRRHGGLVHFHQGPLPGGFHPVPGNVCFPLMN